jgi:hypothetical protein
MATVNLEDRVTALEVEMARLKAKLDKQLSPKVPWWEKIVGTFANDPLYEEAMRLGREYRESLRPKPRNRKKRRDGST